MATKTRLDLIADNAYPTIVEALLDQPLVKVDAESYRHYLAILDEPPRGEGFARLMNAPKPWRR